MTVKLNFKELIIRHLNENAPYSVLVLTKRGVALSYQEVLSAPLSGVHFVSFDDTIQPTDFGESYGA